MKIEDLNENERALLVAIRNRRDKLAARKIPHQPPSPSDYLGFSQWDETNDARKGYVKLNLPRLLGHVPTASERTLCQRAWCQLQRLELIELCSDTCDRIRTTHFRLTPFGEKIADAIEQWAEAKSQIEKQAEASVSELLAKQKHPQGFEDFKAKLRAQNPLRNKPAKPAKPAKKAPVPEPWEEPAPWKKFATKKGINPKTGLMTWKVHYDPNDPNHPKHLFHT